MTAKGCHRGQCPVRVNTVDTYIAWHFLQLNLQPIWTKYKVNIRVLPWICLLLKIASHTSSCRIELMLQILPNTGSAILSDPRDRRDCVGREYHYDHFLFFGSNASQSLAQGLF